ncbi:MAG: DUF418 domain-containing protein [Fimbriimonadaceae bacterium]|nr:DUF418 domain-containing protein [Fimbriimonadaceae bacterium]
MSSVILPTVKNRIESLDFLRGMAILGILLANIFAFGWFGIANEIAGHRSLPGEIPLLEALRVTFITGKARALLCVLFGAGIYLQYRKRLSAGQSWPGSYAWRTVLLLIIGLIHGIFIWYGDILFSYSVVALFAMLCVRMSDRAMFWLAISMLILSILGGFGQLSARADMGGSGDPIASFLAWGEHASEQHVYQAGTYLDQVVFRLKIFAISLMSLPFICLELGAMVAFGFLMAKKGLFSKPSGNLKLTKQLSLVGIAGLVLNFALAFWRLAPGGEVLDPLIEFGFNAPLSIGYAIWGAILIERGIAKGFTNFISPVGKMALTCYLMQSLICTAVFYSWGGGLFARLSFLQILAVVPAVWAVNLIFAHLWLKKFPMGPVEWLWRSMAMGRSATQAIAEVPIGGAVPPPLFEPAANPEFRDGN